MQGGACAEGEWGDSGDVEVDQRGTASMETVSTAPRKAPDVMAMSVVLKWPCQVKIQGKMLSAGAE